MHFRVTDAFTFLLVFLSILSTGTASPLSSSPRTNVVNGLDMRQLVPLEVISTIIDIASNIIQDILDIVAFEQDAHTAESYFTYHIVQSLGLKYPGKNLLVYHDQDSTPNLSLDAVHAHYELDIGWGFTQGYEIWVFDSGTFSLAGDGGYENWAIGGCFSGPSAAVVFTKC